MIINGKNSQKMITQMIITGKYSHKKTENYNRDDNNWQ
jgi:hypothetical protein